MNVEINGSLNIHISEIPDGSFAVRGYKKENSIDYDGFCLVEPRGNGEYEICKWIVRNMPRNYIAKAIDEIIKTIKPEKLTGTFEKKKYKVYKRYFSMNGYNIDIIRNFIKTYNNVRSEFYYVSISPKNFLR